MHPFHSYMRIFHSCTSIQFFPVHYLPIRPALPHNSDHWWNYCKILHIFLLCKLSQIVPHRLPLSLTVPSVIYFRNIVQVIKCNFSSQMIHAMGVHRLQQKNNPSDIPFSFQLNADAGSSLYIVHAIFLSYVASLSQSVRVINIH